MGCTSSDANSGSNLMIANKKPSIWLIGGGPGCQKGKICEYLIRDYKFKYLSSYDMVQFEQQRGGPDADLIFKLFKEKKTMPSDLIVRLVKKAIASCGVRRFLIDGFPNSIQDVLQFDKQLTNRQINFLGFLNIKISEQKMISSGVQAYSEDKTKDKADIEANIREIVKKYQNESEKIIRQYQKKNKYHEVDGEQGAQKTYMKVKNYIQSLGIEPPKPVSVFFSHFDDITHQAKYCNVFAKKYGIYIYSFKDLIDQALSKVYTSEAETLKKLQKQNKQIPSSLIISLMRKKFEKQDYTGRFLFTGYPRNLSDVQQWQKHFRWETQLLGYLSFEVSNQKLRNENKQISSYYERQKKLIAINSQNEEQALNNIKLIFQQEHILSRKKISLAKLIFVNTLSGNGNLTTQIAQGRGAQILKMQNLMEEKIKQNGLYAQLIESFIKIGKPVSGTVATRVLVEKIMEQKKSNLILVEGFPNSLEQLHCWEEEVGDYMEVLLIVLHSQNNKYIEQRVRQKIKDKKIKAQEKDVVELTRQNLMQIEEKLKRSDWKYCTINTLDESSRIEDLFDKSGFN